MTLVLSFRAMFFAIATTVVSAACAPPAKPAAQATPVAELSASTSSGPVTPADPESPPPGTGAMRCDASKVQSAIGKTATQDVIDQAVADSTSGAVRVIKPGQAVTADFSQGRLDLEVDAGNVITKASCG